MEIKKLFKLYKYSLNHKGILILSIFFAVFGLFFDIATLFFPNIFADLFDIGAYFIILSGATFAQCAFSVIYSGLGASSNQYKNILLNASFAFITCSSFIGALIPTLIHILGYIKNPASASSLVLSIIQTGIFAMVFQIYFAFAYKLYAFSSVIFFICILPLANNFVWEAVVGTLISSIPIGIAVVLCFAITLTGSALYYLITKLLYRKPLDDLAFRSSIARAAR